MLAPAGILGEPFYKIFQNFGPCGHIKGTLLQNSQNSRRVGRVGRVFMFYIFYMFYNFYMFYIFHYIYYDRVSLILDPDTTHVNQKLRGESKCCLVNKL